MAYINNNNKIIKLFDVAKLLKISTMINPVLLYSCQTWTLKNTLKEI